VDNPGRSTRPISASVLFWTVRVIVAGCALASFVVLLAAATALVLSRGIPGLEVRGEDVSGQRGGAARARPEPPGTAAMAAAIVAAMRDRGMGDLLSVADGGAQLRRLTN
jgi:hypothetical protein